MSGEVVSRLGRYKAKATEPVFLILHSQYHMDTSLENDCTLSLLGLHLANVGFKFNKRLPDGCEVSTTC